MKPAERKDPAHGVPFLLPQPVQGDPITSMELVNRYGTYEIQPTNDSENFFPTIAQGRYTAQQLHKLRQQTIKDSRAFAQPDVQEREDRTFPS